MKKVLVAAIAIAFTGISFAQDEVAVKTAVEVKEGAEKKVEVKLEELPAAVKETLASDNFKEMKAEKAFLVEGDAKYYEIILAKGEERVVVKINEEGKILA